MKTPHRLPLLLLPALALAADDKPAEWRRAALIERPPFAKAERRDTAKSGAGPLELRGFFGAGADLHASVVRTDTKEARWLRLGDNSGNWTLESADPAAGVADVRFDGMRIHLVLIRPEEPKAEIAAAKTEEPKNEKRSENSRSGRFGSLSPEARDTFRKLMAERMNAARTEHPEYFDGSKLSEEQTRARHDYIRDTFDKVREEVARKYPQDAAAMLVPRDRTRRDNAGDGASAGDNNSSDRTR